MLQNNPSNTNTNNPKNPNKITSIKSNKANNINLKGVVNCRKCRKLQPNTEWYIINLCTNPKCYLRNITKYVKGHFYCEPCYDQTKHEARCHSCNAFKSKTDFLGEWVFPKVEVPKIIHDPFC